MSAHEALPPELRMTEWAARCLRWLGIPRDQLYKLKDLMEELLDRIRKLREDQDALLGVTTANSTPTTATANSTPMGRSGRPTTNRIVIPGNSGSASSGNDTKASGSSGNVSTRNASEAGLSSSSTVSNITTSVRSPNTQSQSQSQSQLPEDDESEYVFEDGDEEVVGKNAKFKKRHVTQVAAARRVRPCHGETLLLMQNRWEKLLSDFYSPTRGFDPSKVPDVYDAIKYDVIHNYALLQSIRPLYQASQKLADFVVPNEYGILSKDKLRIGRLITHKLLDRLVDHFDKATFDRTDVPRVQLYFCSESHIHALRNTMLLSGMPDNRTAATTLEALELNYLSHGVWRLFEDLSQPVDSPDRFFVNFMFSPGAALDPFIFAEDGHLLPVSRPIPITARIPFTEFKARFADLGNRINEKLVDYYKKS